MFPKEMSSNVPLGANSIKLTRMFGGQALTAEINPGCEERVDRLISDLEVSQGHGGPLVARETLLAGVEQAKRDNCALIIRIA